MLSGDAGGLASALLVANSDSARSRRFRHARKLIALAGLGAVGVVRQLSMSQAFKEANATAILPLDFTKLIWVAIIGYAAFAEIPTMWTWAGGFVIFVATTYITVREGGLSRTESGKGRRLGR